MTSIVTLDDYQRITKDTTTDTAIVNDELAAAQQLVEEYLRRPDRLASGTYTDRMRLYSAENIDGGYDGAYLAYPLATPVTAAPGFTILGTRSIAGAFPDGGPFLQGIIGQGVQPYATITYTGGWTSDTLPETIRRVIARTAQQALTPSTVPVGATSVRVGDVAVGYAHPADAGAELSPASQRALRRYIHRRGA